ncbi:hypothetical protein JHW43_008024 [Diplocarpon mali]|nr:hypothetical protein JHW43_008024 [Diplocarpon mali]
MDLSHHLQSAPRSKRNDSRNGWNQARSKSADYSDSAVSSDRAQTYAVAFPAPRYAAVTAGHASTSDAEMHLGPPTPPRVYATLSSQCSLERAPRNLASPPQDSGGEPARAGSSASRGSTSAGNVGDMVLESQEIDMASMSEDMMMWLEYLPHVLNFLDSGSATDAAGHDGLVCAEFNELRKSASASMYVLRFQLHLAYTWTFGDAPHSAAGQAGYEVGAALDSKHGATKAAARKTNGCEQGRLSESEFAGGESVSARFNLRASGASEGVARAEERQEGHRESDTAAK